MADNTAPVNDGSQNAAPDDTKQVQDGADSTKSVQDNPNSTESTQDDSILGEDPKKDGGSSILGDDAAEDDSEEKLGAPEKYEAFSLPENVTFDQEVLTSFEGLARKHGLSQKAAQEFVDLAINNENRNVETFKEQHATLMSEWTSAIKNDPEFGGVKFKETQERARRVIRKFGNDDLRASLKASGYGNNPELIKIFAKIDRAMGEDSSVESAANAAPKTMSIAEALYPSMRKT